MNRDFDRPTIAAIAVAAFALANVAHALVDEVGQREGGDGDRHERGPIDVPAHSSPGGRL